MKMRVLHNNKLTSTLCRCSNKASTYVSFGCCMCFLLLFFCYFTRCSSTAGTLDMWGGTDIYRNSLLIGFFSAVFPPSCFCLIAASHPEEWLKYAYRLCVKNNHYGKSHLLEVKKIMFLFPPCLADLCCDTIPGPHHRPFPTVWRKVRRRFNESVFASRRRDGQVRSSLSFTKSVCVYLTVLLLLAVYEVRRRCLLLLSHFSPSAHGSVYVRRNMGVQIAQREVCGCGGVGVKTVCFAPEDGGR